MKRLEQIGRIDRSQPLQFFFDGKPIHAFAGDTVASALLAHGEKVVARSFKYHRPRGVMAAGVAESNALLTVGQGEHCTPNIPATLIPVEAGLQVFSQNAWPSVQFDWRAVNDGLSPLLAAGFYYKTFMGPVKNTKAWMFFEHHIRKAAGLGRVDSAFDTARYDTHHDFCDVLVVGGGHAGMQAALESVRAGKEVILVEQDTLLGGQLLNVASDSAAGQQLTTLWLDMAQAEASGRLTVRTRTTAFGLYDSQTVGLIEKGRFQANAAAGEPKERFRLARYDELVLACGALERPLIFAGNDRPGVMLAGSVATYLNRYGVLLGEQVLVCTNHNTAYQTAFDLAKAGAQVTVADLRAENEVDDALCTEAQQLNIRLMPNTAVIEAKGAKGLKEAVLADYNAATAQVGAVKERITIDLLAMSGGFTPTVHLSTHWGHKPRYDTAWHSYLPAANLPMNTHCVGWMTGAGLPTFIPVLPLLDQQKRDKAFLDFQHDVQVNDITLAQQEGYQHIELSKRYTTLGMATDQGKTSNMPALEWVAHLKNLAVPEVGTTTFRPPFTPVTVGALAGRAVGHHYRPVRRTAMEPWHKANQAVWTEAGLWRRALWYKTHGDTIEQAYQAEMALVRNGTAIADVSTLGKIDVQGPDAAEFLNRVYINGFAKLPIGKARYGLMLREDGMALDDGTSSRLAEYHYFMTTTTGQAGRVMSHLEWLLQSVWTTLRVTVSSSSDQWAALSIAGKDSRQVLQAAFPGLDLSAESLPHMGFIEGQHDGVPLRIIRLSFSGELAYEVYSPTHYGLAVWEHLLAAGKPWNLGVYGLEALASLRIEKGHVVGSELDGRTTAADVGLGKMASQLKPYWGSALSHSPNLTRHNRPTLVGLVAVEVEQPPSNGSILFFEGEVLSGIGRGHISSSCYSESLGKSIALGFLEGGLSHEGKTIIATSPVQKRTYQLRVVSPHFLDPHGERYLDQPTHG